MNFTQTVVLEQGGAGLAARHARRHSCLAMDSDAAFELKAAAQALGSLLATPYVLDYDLVVLAVAIAFFVRYGLEHGFRDYEISLLAFVWTTPLVARNLAGTIGLPLGLAAMLTLYALILRRAAIDDAVAAPIAHGLVHA